MVWGFLQGFWGFLQGAWGFLQVTIFDPIKAYTSDRLKKVTAFLKGLQYFLMMAIKFLYLVNVLGCAFHSYGFAKDAFSIKNFNDCVNNLMQLRAYVYSFVLMALSVYAVWCKIVTNGNPISDFLTKNHLTIAILFFVSHEYSGYLVDILRIPMLKFASFAYGLLICELTLEDPAFNSGLPQAALVAFIQVFVWICAQKGKDLVLIFSCVITIFAALLSLILRLISDGNVDNDGHAGDQPV
ncbi:hypothetical protein C5167_013034 [Papaver somniferum]|uniref:Uncharacterized protein n=1 Tax=Papaver somniferum TaxID=3469 RepID=A0A4Y7J292_PAPSO|nr:hypothetical protein C5167_013034 [Papaver somniferum]